MIADTQATWRLLPFSRQPADEQMALAEIMLAATQGPALRWRQITPEALLLGHAQALAAVDVEACRMASCGVYRRATGGTAVLSGPDLLGLDVVLPAGHPLAPADVTRTYAWLGDALATGLRALGVDATPIMPEAARAHANQTPVDSPLHLACYATLSPHEVVAGERKLVGLAQLRRRTGVLLQAGVLLRWRPERLVPLLAVPDSVHPEMISALQQRAIGLDNVLGPIDTETLMEHINAAIGVATGARLVPAAWTEAELAMEAEARLNYEPLATRAVK